MHRRSVDFPEPLGPTMHTVSPGMTARSMETRTSCPPNCLTRPRSSTAGTGSVAMTAPHHGGQPLTALHEILDGATQAPIQQGGDEKGLERHEIGGLDGGRRVVQLGKRDD